MEDSPAHEPGFNTQAVERLTGVPADTFRAWERRYGVPSPRRTAGGRRVYSARDVEVVRWLRSQTDNGVSASLAVEQLKQDPRPSMVGAAANLSLAPPELARALVRAALEFNTEAADLALSHAISGHPLDVVCIEVVTPALVELGERWHRGEITPAVEHFGTGMIRRRLEQVAALLDSGTGRPLVVVGAGPGELHDVGALIFSILLRRRGINVVFLGSSLPEEGVIDVIRKLKPDVLCLAASTPAAAAQIASVGRALRVLPDHTTRFGFGGRAFDQDQTLIDQTPGEYLGEHASDAVSRVAAMLQERTQ